MSRDYLDRYIVNRVFENNKIPYEFDILSINNMNGHLYLKYLSQSYLPKIVIVKFNSNFEINSMGMFE